jgi:hypothetical protein
MMLLNTYLILLIDQKLMIPDTILLLARDTAFSRFRLARRFARSMFTVVVASLSHLRGHRPWEKKLTKERCLST